MTLPDRIGTYHIERVVGTGGMGTVYEARQESPKRVVALKVMRAGLETKDAQRRFEYEVEVLARLRHPGIAAIYEAGTLVDGDDTIPWFSMEYVAGARSLTEYASEKELDPTERLELFEQVCDAVHHGHQRGVIHRDLKPENILVDRQGTVKIIDFGVAKATGDDMSPRTRLTTRGELVGTLQYMSPEQIDSDPRDLDTRTDTYSLGVVLYELLAGRLPYKVENESLLEGVSAILSQPPSPLSTSGQVFAPEFDLVVSKALAKERERRYATALDLRQDLVNLRTGNSISARSPSLVYQLRGFARRHKAFVGSALAIVAALVLGLAASLTMYVRAERARVAEVEAKEKAREAQGAAEAARKEEARQRARAVQQRERAEENERLAAHEAETLKAVNQFINQDILGMANPNNTADRDLTVREALDLSAERIAHRFPDAPLVEAEVRHTLANAYMELGLREKAEPHFERSLELRREHLGADHTKTIKSLGDLGALWWYLGRREEAEALLAQAAEATERATGPESVKTLRVRQNLAFMRMRLGRSAEAEAVLAPLLETLERLRGPDDMDVYMAMNSLAEARADQGRVEEAIQTLRGLVERLLHTKRPDHPFTLSVMATLGVFLNQTKRHVEAQELLEQALERHREVLGEDHPNILATMGTLGLALHGQGKHDAAVAILKEVLESQLRILPKGHPSIMSSYDALTQVLWAGGSRAEAIEVAEAAFRHHVDAHGLEHQNSLALGFMLGRRYEAVGRREDAEREYRSALEMARAAGHAGGPHVLRMACQLATVLQDGEHFAKSEAILVQAWDDVQPPAPVGQAGRRTVATQLAGLLSAEGREEEAASWRERAAEAE